MLRDLEVEKARLQRLLLNVLPQRIIDRLEAGETAIAEAALRMQAFAIERGAAGGWQVRIGIHAGPIIAGVVGTSKFAYAVWGDTVNTASRLESTSEAGRIHVSADLARRLESGFVVERRGMVDLKGKGVTETYWLVGRRQRPWWPGCSLATL
ncbi:MAG: hypothetical protein HYX55_00720 [Chloroflexi bacterium]|nr:hypothetical protein [Chloroflexota bacterium]